MIKPVADARVWNSVRWLYMGSGVLFLANISLGILNVFSPETINRGQILAHFHAGSIGWITLSVIATMFWVFTGQRAVSDQYANFVSYVVIVGIGAVAGYIAGFGAFFSSGANAWLLPLFGIPTWLVIVSSMGFAWAQLKHQPVVTNVHLLLFGALIVASLGATMGVLWGLHYETGTYLAPAAADGVGAHAAPMDMYLALAFAGLVELQLRPDDARRWTKPGLTQMILGIGGGFVASMALYTGLGMIIPLALLAFLVGFGFYLVRIGWRTFTVNPFAKGRAPALFWGGLAYPAYILLFVLLVFQYFIPGVEPPHALLIVFLHVTFIGAGTNLLLATQSAYAAGAQDRAGQAVAFWLLNLGMLAFFASELAAGRREGALLMALGVVLSLLIVWWRLGHAWQPPGPAPEPVYKERHKSAARAR